MNCCNEMIGVWLDFSLRLEMLSNLAVDMLSMSLSASNSFLNKHLWFSSSMYSQDLYFSECSDSVVSLVLELEDFRLRSSSQRLNSTYEKIFSKIITITQKKCKIFAFVSQK